MSECIYLLFRGGSGDREDDEEKDEDCGDTPVNRLTQSLLMQTAPQRASSSRRRQDSREYRCVVVGLVSKRNYSNNPKLDSITVN